LPPVLELNAAQDLRVQTEELVAAGSPQFSLPGNKLTPGRQHKAGCTILHAERS